MELLRVEKVTAGYGDVPILTDVSISVGSEETVVLIGPNGAGKSTLLKCIVGLVATRSGTITYDGVELTALPVQARHDMGLSYVPQADNVFPALTVRENLELAAPRKSRRHTVARHVDRVIDIFPDLAGLLRKPAVLLSGGQRQMVAFARALVNEPRMVVMDEPSSGLTPALTSRVFEYLRRVRDAGVSVLLVEQNARQALANADRGYVLEGGRNAMQGTASSLLADQRTIDVYLGGRSAARLDG